MNTTAQAPLSQEERLVSLDVMRGVALFGILLMNITGFGLPYAYNDPTVYGGATGADLYAWLATSLFFEGTQRALFSMLFGAGTLLLTSRIEARGTDHEDLGYLTAADAAYRSLPEAEGYEIIDANGDHAGVQYALRAVLAARLGIIVAAPDTLERLIHTPRVAPHGHPDE